jgi:3D-(3,5/4)-trihydroxycyclohexane-1,2-dione acylhydrolase (decyclizing)
MLDKTPAPDVAARTRAARLAKMPFDEAMGQDPADALLETTLSEALVIGLLKQGVRHYFAIFGHGSTDLGEVLRVYHEEGAVTVVNCRNEVEMAHAATAHAWVYGETPAVVTSIGPGGLAGDGGLARRGVERCRRLPHLRGRDDTGRRLQHAAGPEARTGRLRQDRRADGTILHASHARRAARMPAPRHVLRPSPLSRGAVLRAAADQHAAPAGYGECGTLPGKSSIPATAPADPTVFDAAVDLIRATEKVVIKAGGGTRGHAAALRKLACAVGAPVVLSPGSTGVMMDGHAQNMHVGGSKGSISGNFAMEGAELVIMIGSRGVCQADCSGIGYPNARAVVNINGDLDDLSHYANTVALPGDITAVIRAADAAGGDTGLEPRRTGRRPAWPRRRNGPNSNPNGFTPRRFATRSGRCRC